MAGDTKHILQSLAVNVVIAAAKGAAAIFTGSGAMLAEAIHSGADCTNQVLLLVGVKRAVKKPSPQHPLGYGRAMYFWSFIVALLLFSGGGVFSMYEGVHKLRAPEPIEHVGLAVGILLFSLALEGWATWGNLKEMKQRRGATPLLRYLRETKDSDLVVIFGENSAAVAGLVLALVSLGLAWKTGDPRFDAAGSLGIGVVLIAVAVFLGIEVQSLLLGERADPSVEATARAVAVGMDGIEEVLTVLTVQQGPGEVLLAMKLRLREGMTTAQVVDSINRYEEKLKVAVPTVRWCFVEPDHVV